MSLDVYLSRKRLVSYDGAKTFYEEYEECYQSNITHNLGIMADAAGIYKALWRPEEIGITKAGDLVPIIENGLADMKERPEYYKQFDTPNGWGTYKDFVPWIEEYLDACKIYPEAQITVSR
jgi:hypothetical protein